MDVPSAAQIVHIRLPDKLSCAVLEVHPAAAGRTTSRRHAKRRPAPHAAVLWPRQRVHKRQLQRAPRPRLELNPPLHPQPYLSETSPEVMFCVQLRCSSYVNTASPFVRRPRWVKRVAEDPGGCAAEHVTYRIQVVYPTLPEVCV